MTTRSQSSSHLPDHWLRLARNVLITGVVLMLCLWAAGTSLLPGYTSRHYLEVTPNDFWTKEQTQAALVELGWPAMTVAWYTAAADTFIMFISMGFVIFLLWRKSDDWFGLFLTLSFLISAPGGSFIDPIIERAPALVGIFDLFGATGWQLMFIVFYIFPDGRFVPQWTRWMPIIWLGVNLPGWLLSFSVLDSGLGLWIGVSLVASAVLSQVYRYFWRSSPVQRQQTKWVVAVLAGLLLLFVLLGPVVFTPPPEDALGPALQSALFGGALFRLSILFLPAAMILAILRYRLWDIDLLIRKTLVYTMLTALLVGVYFGGITILQNIFSALSGQQSPAATVISTLAIAALFNPLRIRLQDFIDRRFYRSKYNAEKALADFATAARSQSDLNQLTQQLTQVVHNTMQPDQLSLWLSPGSQRRKPTEKPT